MTRSHLGLNGMPFGCHFTLYPVVFPSLSHERWRPSRLCSLDEVEKGGRNSIVAS